MPDRMPEDMSDRMPEDMPDKMGFTEQVEELLRKGPPTYLRELTDKLEAKAASTLERLQSWPVYDALQASWHSALPVGPNRFWLKRSGGEIESCSCSDLMK